MKNLKIFQFYSNLPSWTKGVLVVFILLLILFVLYLILKAAKKTDEEKDIKKDKNKFIQEGQKPSYPLTNYQSFASRIYSSGLTTFGTDEDAIYDVFKKMQNDLDVVMLIEAFGNRRLEFTIGSGENLGAFLQSELDTDEIEEINKILAGKNIQYRF